MTTTVNNELNPGKLLQLSGSYWNTCTLHAGVKLDVFTVIGEKKLSAHDVAAQMKAPERSLAMLLDALCAMELLEKTGDLYSNSIVSSTFLSKSSPKYIGFMIMHHHHLVESWSRLDESVMSGKPVRSRATFSDDAKRESFLMGMFNIAMATAPGLVPTIDISGRKTLLDLGGGPGTYAIQFCLHNKDIKATVFDLPTTRPFAEKTIARFNQQDRITFQGGNFLVDEIKASFDVVWISHILHAETPEDCHKLIKKAASVLNPGGMIIIHDFILNNSRSAPLFPALFSLNMLVGTDGGQSYSEVEIMDMLDDAGFVNMERTPYKGPMESGIITALMPDI
ncbi:SAM-dependent methyltransferase [Desulfamplus magnetovallimortis]|uniref:SAM-dependent methyltransferase n=1 Tax=Desulfamplus magnetovallimortis TaxID=1246637 RepID=A0A1W1HCP9_9BACT|nr:methyltransferase [Desulfamplus magnetovallimortis]SLM30264.1 SAM-dependent methyltransferase [Desulfamplus magnetovallimortis]